MNISLPSSGNGVPEAGGVFSVFPDFTEVVLGLDTGGASPVVLVAKNPPANAGDVGLIPGSEDPLEKEMATRSSVLAWRISWTEETGGLQSTGSQRIGHN